MVNAIAKVEKNAKMAMLCLLLLPSCISSPSDPIAFGELCEPSTDKCPNTVLFTRDSVGRNQLDYTLENLGPDPVSVEVLALSQEVSSLDLTSVDPDLIIARQTHSLIQSTAKIGNRITPKLLGTRDAFRLFILCKDENPTCNIKVDYVFESVPVECFDDNDCSSGRLCNVPVGHCVECLSAEDCNDDQSCDALQNTCTPEDATPSCSTSPDGPSFLFLMIFVFLFFGWRRGRATTGTPLLLTLFFVLFLATFSSSAFALPPPTPAISVGGGVRYFLGDLGNDTQRGIGLHIAQELRWRYVGAFVLLGTSFYQTTQDPPPFSRGLGTYTAAIGPRFFLAFGKNELALSADIRRIGFLSNSLVRVTGLENDFTAAAFGLGYRYHFEKVEIKLDASVAPFFSLPGSVLSFDISIGFNAN